jgi:DNA-binding IclR family transcriptional regulator
MPDRNAAPHSQTLDRGVRALEVLAEAGRPLSIADLSARLQVHRSIAYRIVRTLEDHRLMSRDGDGRLVPGVGLAALARSVKSSLQTAALPELSDLANDLGMTSFLVVEDEGEAVTVETVEPRHSTVHVAYRPGVRHAVDRGAPGLALLAGLAEAPGERPEVAQARVRGWATTQGEVLTGMRAVASPVLDGRGRVAGAVSVVFVDSQYTLDEIGARVGAAAKAIARELP